MKRLLVCWVILCYPVLSLLQSVKICELIKEPAMNFHGASRVFDLVAVSIADCFVHVVVLVASSELIPATTQT